jgi:N-acetylglucosaminylphosphatidylinositol deacetylase
LTGSAAQDGLRERWSEHLVAQLVGDAARAVRARSVLTFDARGVSGHPNHVATYRGVLAWARAQRGVDCWLLVRRPLASRVLM